MVPITKPYKLASRQFKHGEATVVEVDGRRVGGGNFSLIAGPCTVESRDQLLATAEAVKDGGASMLRGGAYKPRTSPYSFQGLGGEGLRLLAEAKEETGLPIVTELMDLARHRAGARGCRRDPGRRAQHAELLAAGRDRPLGAPVLLKRGLSAQIEELLMAAEYVLKEGNEQVMLCERGIRTFETATRFTLDIMAIPVLKQLSHLPVVVDPSHAAGRRDLVLPLSLAAAAAGADGIIVEVHHDPDAAICDGPQAVPADEFGDYVEQVSAWPRSSARSCRRSEHRRCRRRRPDRRLDRPRRPGAPRRVHGSSGYDRDPRALEAALERHAIDERCASPELAAHDVDVCFVCCPVGALGAQVGAALGAGGDGVVTDVGSDQARRAGRRARRTASLKQTARASSAGTRWRAPRPPACEHARADLFEGATWYLTPTERTSGIHYDRLYRAISGARRAPGGDRRRRPTTA